MSHAIVIGGSIAGMCAAAALARNFDRVTVLERDLEPGSEARRGAPQGNHAHGLLNRGQAIMDELFPGLFDALARAGALRIDIGTSMRWFHFGSWRIRTPLGVHMWCQSRPLLEHHIRQILAGNPKVELRSGISVAAPIHENGRVRAVRLGDGSELDAELVVDATGRGSRSPKWLEQWGYGVVPEQRVRVGLAYVSGTFEVKDNAAQHAKETIAIYQHQPLGNKRGGLCSPVGADRMVVSLFGYHGDHPPTEITAFRKWAKTLLRPDIAVALDDLRLIGELHKFTYPEQLRRCYGTMRRLPEGYLIVGDAMCSFDPTFAQGMALGALQAEHLAKRARPGRSTQRLQRQLYRMTELPFKMTSCEAHRWSETTGWKPAFSGAMQACFSKMFEAASHDAEVYGALLRVMHFIAQPSELMRPGFFWRVLTRRDPQAALERPASAFAGELSSPALSRTGF
jgi:2-polyprenyl-6-methoxyphenol hydroxylase-like FAD-dependent oxidoreductase